uniref:Uncharacterized protein n=1 Tax=viral metagenome TaxID=1070528 RepID=A0A6M3J4R0_9ZZZZ
MAAHKEVTRLSLFNGTSLPASGILTSSGIDLSLAQNGYFAVEISVCGGSRINVTYLVSITGVTFGTPTSATSIVTHMTGTSGPSSNGWDIYTFTPELGKLMKIKIAEQAGTAGAVFVDLALA